MRLDRGKPGSVEFPAAAAHHLRALRAARGSAHPAEPLAARCHRLGDCHCLVPPAPQSIPAGAAGPEPVTAGCHRPVAHRRRLRTAGPQRHPPGTRLQPRGPGCSPDPASHRLQGLCFPLHRPSALFRDSARAEHQDRGWDSVWDAAAASRSAAD